MYLNYIYKRAFRISKKLILSSFNYKYWIYFQILFLLNKKRKTPSKKFLKNLLKARDYQLIR